MPACKSSSLKVAAAVLLTTWGALADAQSFVPKLFPRPELLKAVSEPGTLAQEPSANIGLHIEIMSGDRGINIIKKKTAVKPVVEVRDRNNLPVAGAAVTFASPGDGPSLIFANGARSITVTTDAAGRASTVGMRPVTPGNFQVNVSASFHSQTATATMSMTNVMTAAAAAAAAGVGGTVAAGGAAGLSTGVIVAIVAVAAGAAVGIGVGLGHHGSSSGSSGGGSTIPTVTIGVGSGGTVSGPHLRHGWHSGSF